MKKLTYDQGTNKVCHLILAEIEIFVGVGKLSEVESCLLLDKGATGEVGLFQHPWYFRDASCFGGEVATPVSGLVAQELNTLAVESD